jgi:uncharacterized damage-inducible protein DinB
MKNAFCACLASVLLLFAVAASAQPKEATTKTIPDSLNYMWKMVEKDFTALADAMPEDKWSFKPTQGDFKDVRTFGEQVKHVACGNEAWSKKLHGEKDLPDRCDLGGPNPAKTKAEIMAYLKQTFQSVDDGIAATNAGNLLQTLAGPYAGANRLEVVHSALWHTTDHYGQLVVYLRLNGIVPPASR